jgi:general secretion pathway protein C
MMKKYITILNLFLIGAIIYFCVNTFYGIAAMQLDPGPPNPAGSSKKSDPVKKTLLPLSHYKTIFERNLFQTNTKANIKTSSINIDTLKQTDLKLKLWGTVTGLEDKTYAVIEEAKTRKQNLFRIGDTVQNATVKMVLREKVVLNVNGKDEVLEIEKAHSRGRYSPPAQGIQRPGSGRSQKITLKRAHIENALADVNDLLTQVTIQPHFQDGKQDGILLTRIKPRSIFLRMGLRNGDIITGVNGKPLESVDDALKFYTSVSSGENLSLHLKRRGRSRTIEYSIK